MPDKPAFDVQAHEDRLQKVEADVRDLTVARAEHDLKISYLSQQVEDGFKSVLDRIDSHVGPLAEKSEENSQRLEAQAERIGEQERAIEVVESRERDHRASRARWRKWLSGVVIGAVAIALEELVKFLLTRGL